MCRSLTLIDKAKKSKRRWGLDSKTGLWHCHNVAIFRGDVVHGSMVHFRYLEDAVKRGEFSYKPIIIGHDCKPENIIGYIGDDCVYRDKQVIGTLWFTDNRVLDLLDRGIKQLSPGYACNDMQFAGSYLGQDFQSINHRLKINHIGIVETGALGASVSL